MRKLLILVSSALILSLIACGGKSPKAGELSHLPDWIVKGSGAFSGDGGQVFYGVGVANRSKNQAMLDSIAENRARAKIAQVFKNYSAVLMKDYMATASASAEGGKSTDEQYVEQAIKTFAAATLSGVVIVKKYRDKDGNLYALAKLDLNAFKDSLEKMNELDQKVKEHIRKNAERVHMDLEKEEAKHAGK